MQTFQIGEYAIVVNGQEYTVELINYNGDTRYSLENGQTSRVVSLGDSSTEYKTLVVKYHGDLTIDKGVTVTANTVNNLTYKKGMYLCVLGDIKNEGKISMSARGTYNQKGENVYLWKNIDNSYEYVPEIGGAGANGIYSSGTVTGLSGENGTNRKTGGRRLTEEHLEQNQELVQLEHHTQEAQEAVEEVPQMEEMHLLMEAQEEQEEEEATEAEQEIQQDQEEQTAQVDF